MAEIKGWKKTFILAASVLAYFAVRNTISYYIIKKERVASRDCRHYDCRTAVQKEYYRK